MKATEPSVRRSKRKQVNEETETEQPETEMETKQPEKETESEQQERETTQTANNKKRTRGPTKMRKLAKDAMEKVDVDFSAIGKHSGPGSVTLSSFLGALVREHVPVLFDDWRAVDCATKDIMWEEIKARFNLEEGWQRHSVFKQMGASWRAYKCRFVTKIKKCKSGIERLKLKPSNIQSLSSSNNWVKSRTSPAFKVKNEKYRNLRKSQILHITSCKGMFRLSMEMKKKSPDPRKVTRSKVWLAGHTHSDGRPVKPEFQDTIEKIRSTDSQMDSTTTENVREDAISQVLGKDRYGRVRGMDRGISLNKLEYINARDAHVQKLEASQAEMLGKIVELHNDVRCLLSGRRPSGVEFDAQSNVSITNKGGIKCKILAWCGPEVVVGEGEFCSSDPNYMIGRIQLGPDAAAIIAHTATKPDAFVWRPTKTLYTITEAIGLEIPWPAERLILASDNISTTGHKPEASDETNDKCNIFAWNVTEIIGEGVICSVDPTDKVNHITLGPNAAIVKVLTVIHHDAFLLRPSIDMAVLGDVLIETIAWPLDKIGCDANTSVPDVSA
ncbi:PREDICTED: uncharacterized protein LOC104750353 [Camelina sativa]|uniref:Uncharacterized protein LOC104750353 n=1 Tax=Camelina sativa TaxID=90675 RepID=A0ABM0WFP5_CAMSA|nr:PREDICTED: uncharacterized protein LOC104750353 [Camelina sativa]